MKVARDTRIADLQKQILPLQGYKYNAPASIASIGLGSLNEAFPARSFPVGAVHEFLYKAPSQLAATCGFISGILSSLMKQGAVTLWIDAVSSVFPPALAQYATDPSHIIFIRANAVKEMNWAVEEALGCEGLAAVVANLPGMDFTFSRRLQLAVEKSSVTAFILRDEKKQLNNTACIARWKIKSLPSETGAMPGVGFPRWDVELLKVRNGSPGKWVFEWANGSFEQIMTTDRGEEVLKKKAV